MQMQMQMQEGIESYNIYYTVALKVKNISQNQHFRKPNEMTNYKKGRDHMGLW